MFVRLVRRARAARAACLAAALGLAGAAAASAAPQQPAAPAASPIQGVVVDASGGAIPGAVVLLVTAAGDLTAVTDAEGRFTFPYAPASGTLRVTFDGFVPVSTAISPARRRVRLVLEPLPLTASVTVRGTLPRVASASRTTTEVRDLPQSISIVTRDLIADQSMRSMADVVNYVPGVGMAQGEGHRDAPIFRGNTSTADFYVDGFRDDTQYLRDLYNVERIEVLKGPNGMLFGRGGAGGVINRVTRQADFTSPHELTVQAGSWGQRRVSADFGGVIGHRASARITGMFENSDTYRRGVGLERFGLNPTMAFTIGRSTEVRAGYELFRDERTTDRGIPSFEGRPLDIDRGTFFGNPSVNTTDVTVHALFATIEHRTRGGARLRQQLRFADYDKFYQNLVPGAVSAARTLVPLSGYSNETARQNVFAQTDVTVVRRTGPIEHQLLAGIEVGRQVTDNHRRTAYFTALGPGVTSISVPLADPASTLPVEFRSSASDARNHGVATTAAIFAQDQVALSRQVHVILGARYDRFDVDLLDHRNGATFATTDGLLSPQLAVVYKPVTPLSLYASYSLSYLPRAGEQMASLTLSNQALEPENYRNHEIGAKWAIGATASLTAALYRLDRGNVAVADALDPTRSHLVDGERMTGLEVELSGRWFDRWSVNGGYAFQDGEIRHALSSAVRAGARLAQVPRHTFSMWNRIDVTRSWGVGLGVISRDDSFVATDNRVTLPGFTRVDGALFVALSPRLRAHVNVENVFDAHYYWSAHNNNNIAPGSPRAVRLSLTTRF